jgi:hypothetical protein
MSMVPNPGSAVFASGYSAEPHSGFPTSPDDQVTNGTLFVGARKALALGVLGIFPLSILAGIPAIFVGAHALRRIKASAGSLTGRGFAWTGIILGSLSVPVFLALVYAVRH